MDFNIRQQNVINANNKNILCLAAAASGKTRTLVGRIERLLDEGVEPSSIVAFTFTNQAAKEMKIRLGEKSKDMFIGTVHSYANKICGLAGIETKRDIAEERFDRIIDKALGVNWNLYPQVSHLFVDEFQDTDPLQYRFIQRIPVENRFYTGDERQFIYGFRSATDEFIRKLAVDDSFKKYFLVENYRNPKNILKYADNFLNSMPKISPPSIAMSTIKGFIDECSFKDAAEEMTWTEDWTGWVVLCRTNSEILEAQKYLDSINIPNVIVKRGDLDLEQMENLLEQNRVKIMTIHACITGDTIVPTSLGLMTIKELVKRKDFNIKVFNGEKYDSVNKFICNPPQKILKITTSFGNQIRVSENHDVVVLTKEGYQKIKAKDLTGKEELLIKKGISDYLFDDIKLIQNNENDFDIRAIKYETPLFLTEDLCELIGLITADGSYNHSSIHYIKYYKECVVRFAELIEKIFRKKIEVKHCPDREAWYAECNSIYILEFLKKNFDGIVPKNKKVSSLILRTSKENQCAFLRGLFEDGTVQLKNNRVDNICLCFKNDAMRIQLQSMMALLGIPVSFVKRKYNKKEINYLYIYSTGLEIFKEKINFISNFKKERISSFVQKYDRRNKSKALKELLLEHKEEAYVIRESKFWNNLIKNETITKEGFLKYYNKLSDIQKQYSFIQYVKNSFENYEIEQISSIEEDGIEETYCLEMKDKSQFIQNGFLMGNCKGLEFPYVVVIGAKAFNQEERRICYVAATRAKNSLYWCPTIKTYKGKPKTYDYHAGNIFSKTNKRSIQF